MANSFAPLKSQDFGVVDSDGKLLGHLRVRPFSVSWRAADRAKWRRIKLNEFIRLADDYGEDADN